MGFSLPQHILSRLQQNEGDVRPTVARKLSHSTTPNRGSTQIQSVAEVHLAHRRPHTTSLGSFEGPYEHLCFFHPPSTMPCLEQAYTLEPQSGGGGKQVLNFLLAEIENRRGELVVAFAGYAKNMETLFEFNEGLPSRFPKVLRFEDYSDALLLEIFKGLMANKKGLGTLHFGDSAEQEDAERWAKVAVARLGRRRGSRGFGNARAVRVLFDQVLERQASRLSSGDNDDDPYELTKPDLLGRSVSSLDESESWRTLRDMIGLSAVKSAVLALAEVVQTNRVLEEAGKPPRDIALNRCMLGNPGTGEEVLPLNPRANTKGHTHTRST